MTPGFRRDIIDRRRKISDIVNADDREDRGVGGDISTRQQERREPNNRYPHPSKALLNQHRPTNIKTLQVGNVDSSYGRHSASVRPRPCPTRTATSVIGPGPSARLGFLFSFLGGHSRQRNGTTLVRSRSNAGVSTINAGVSTAAERSRPRSGQSQLTCHRLEQWRPQSAFFRPTSPATMSLPSTPPRRIFHTQQANPQTNLSHQRPSTTTHHTTRQST